MTTQTQPALEAHDSPRVLAPDEREYIKGLYDEVSNLQDPVEQDEHRVAIAELVGDIALSEKLRQEAQEDRLVAETLASEFRTNRAVEAARRMEARGYAQNAPDFREQILDDTRTNTFSYNGLPSHMSKVEGWPEYETTETEALHELDAFLHKFINTTARDGNHPFPEDAEQARSIADNLTFIGEKELREAVQGLGMLWKNYLDGDPARKLCILTAISNSAKYKGVQKSDTYLRDKILETFSDDDFEKYSGRIVENIDEIQDENPENVRIVLVDDWTVSGKQLSKAHSEIAEDPDNYPFLGSVEINLLVASEERLSEGFRDQHGHPSLRPVKVRAYYKSHSAIGARSASKSHVSGIHSTVNFDFGNPIEVMVKRLQRRGQNVQIPALASIVSPYEKNLPTRGKS